jgi:8-oxo-dGTP diphosphatase
MTEVFAGLGLITKNNKILLAQRSPSCILYPLKWCLPGGKGEENETPREATIREIKEETHLEFIPEELVCTSIFGKRKLYMYKGTFTGEIIPQESEIAKLQWFTQKEIKELDMAFNHKELLLTHYFSL